MVFLASLRIIRATAHASWSWRQSTLKFAFHARFKKLNTGICISLPENSYGFIIDKSSLASKGLLTLGKVINKYYTREIIVIMASLIEPIKIKKGQKIAQLIVSNIMYPEIKKVKLLRDTGRNNEGFGKMDDINFSKKI